MREVTVGVAPDMPTLVPWQYGLDVAAGWKGRLKAVLVNDSFSRGAPAFASGDVLADSTRRLRELWEAKAEGIESRIQDQARRRHVKLNVVRREGRIVDDILDAGQDSDLIVVGRGRRSLDHPGSLGSRIEVLARRCSGAIFLSPLEYRSPKRVVAAFAGKSLGERVLDLGADLAEAFGVGLIVLTAGKDRDWIREIHERARNRLVSRTDEVDYVAVIGTPEEALPVRVDEEDVLVMGPHGRSPVYRMLFGRVTDRVIRAVRGPLVLAPREA